jgi:glycosyltransferase involved in cell wall biosynthesis
LTAKLQHLMFRPAVKFNMLNADYNFSYGGKISEITNEIGVEWDKILAFPTGIGEDWLYEDYQNKEVITFLFVGRYERLKGIEELNEAIESIEANYKFKFLFVGPIPDDKKINSFKVEYLGRIMDAEKLKKVYKNADIVVCPSYSEGMPNVIMEGMAQSLSTIATDVGAVNQMVNNKNGWLLHSSNPNEIKEALIAAILMSKDNLSLKKKDSYNIIVNNFLWGTIAQNISTRLNKIIK